MAQKLNASMPEGLDLEFTYQIVIAAIDPSTGGLVSGVEISSAYLTVDQVSDGAPVDLQSGPFMLVPGPGAGG